MFSEFKYCQGYIFLYHYRQRAVRRLVTLECRRNTFIIKGFKCGILDILEKIKMLDSPSSLRGMISGKYLFSSS